MTINDVEIDDNDHEDQNFRCDDDNSLHDTKAVVIISVKMIIMMTMTGAYDDHHDKTVIMMIMSRTYDDHHDRIMIMMKTGT